MWDARLVTKPHSLSFAAGHLVSNGLCNHGNFDERPWSFCYVQCNLLLKVSYQPHIKIYDYYLELSATGLGFYGQFEGHEIDILGVKINKNQVYN